MPRLSCSPRAATGVAALTFALATAACSPQEMADKAMRRTAETVVRPVVDDGLTGPQADAATACILDAATSSDLQALSRDVGVYAGTSTVARVNDIASRPQAVSCLRAAGVPARWGL